MAFFRSAARTKQSHTGRTTTRHTAQRMVGLDFGAHTLKLVEVEHGPLGPVVRTFGVAPYEMDRAGRADLVKTLEQLAHSARISTPNVILTLPETDVCTIATGHDPTQLQSRLNPRLAQVAVCWPLEDRLLTLPRWTYDFYDQVVKTAGLTLGGVQSTSGSLGKSVAHAGRAGVLDVGAESTGWYVFDYGQPVQWVTLPYGSEALTQALALAHGWTREHAEEHKRTLAGDPRTWPEESQLVVKTFVDRWWQDLFKDLAEQPAHLQDLVLVGGGSRLGSLREHVFAEFGLLPREWRLPATTHVSEDLRSHLDPHVSVLANSLAHLVY